MIKPLKAKNRIGHAPIIYVQEAFYLIGGQEGGNGATQEPIKTIAKLNLNSKAKPKWKKVGELQSARDFHNAIFDGFYIIVIGGKPANYDRAGKILTETCKIEGNQVSCISRPPNLANYEHYPELFLVPQNFCETTGMATNKY